MKHRKVEHEENIETCKLFQKGECTYNEKCWFTHKNSKIDKMKKCNMLNVTSPL